MDMIVRYVTGGFVRIVNYRPCVTDKTDTLFLIDTDVNVSKILVIKDSFVI